MKHEGMRQSLVHIILTTLLRKYVVGPIFAIEDLWVYSKLTSLPSHTKHQLSSVTLSKNLKQCAILEIIKIQIFFQKIFPPFVTELGNCS